MLFLSKTILQNYNINVFLRQFLDKEKIPLLLFNLNKNVVYHIILVTVQLNNVQTLLTMFSNISPQKVKPRGREVVFDINLDFKSRKSKFS